MGMMNTFTWSVLFIRPSGWINLGCVWRWTHHKFFWPNYVIYYDYAQLNVLLLTVPIPHFFWISLIFVPLFIFVQKKVKNSFTRFIFGSESPVGSCPLFPEYSSVLLPMQSSLLLVCFYRKNDCKFLFVCGDSPRACGSWASVIAPTGPAIGSSTWIGSRESNQSGILFHKYYNLEAITALICASCHHRNQYHNTFGNCSKSHSFSRETPVVLPSTIPKAANSSAPSGTGRSKWTLAVYKKSVMKSPNRPKLLGLDCCWRER